MLLLFRVITKGRGPGISPDYSERKLPATFIVKLIQTYTRKFYIKKETSVLHDSLRLS